MNYVGYFEGDFKGDGIVGMNSRKIIIAFLTPPKSGILFDFTGYVKLTNIYYYVDEKTRLISGYTQIKEDNWERNNNKFEDGSVEYEKLDTKREINKNIKGESSISYKLNGITKKVSPKAIKKKYSQARRESLEKLRKSI